MIGVSLNLVGRTDERTESEETRQLKTKTKQNKNDAGRRRRTPKKPVISDARNEASSTGAKSAGPRPTLSQKKGSQIAKKKEKRKRLRHGERRRPFASSLVLFFAQFFAKLLSTDFQRPIVYWATTLSGFLPSFSFLIIFCVFFATDLDGEIRRAASKKSKAKKVAGGSGPIRTLL